ncbi:hypothetical protein GCM10009676_18080 [Prauserella halophila]|uniref:DUF4064 domain-containing protein n=1 Tax=Prauserella halophila TaxID=185641 RepID=A0ABP4GRV3_9PSEU|nr:hypothetical protein [Prauserella halophila]MCP2235990.1 hypothetical protein [Prauserella halophila]
MTSEGTEHANEVAGSDSGDATEGVQPPESSPQPAESSPLPAAPSDAPAAGAGAKRSATGVLGGIAVVSSGLGLSSLIGNPLSDMLRAREEIVGQIEAGTGGGGDQIEAFYGAPWHTAALVNGVVALVAAVIGGVVLAVQARRSDSSPWVIAVALGGVVLGLLGLLVAGGMYLDLFAAQPELPTAPQLGTGG